MLVSQYDDFVQASDQSAGRPLNERMDIALYGLAAEIGSLISAMKKRLLAEGGDERWNQPNEEIIEEIGDVMWYAFALSRIASEDARINIFTTDIANLRRELRGTDENAQRVQRALDASKRELFLNATQSFPLTKEMQFEDYQGVAYLTARTEPRVLVEVCLIVLWQLVAELLRRKLPESEREINRSVADRQLKRVLGEIAWHVSALASIYCLKLSDIAQFNIDKVSFRLNRSRPTPLHDALFPANEQFPRFFEVSFVSIGRGRSRMYVDGIQVGDDLTDNSYDEDGYRFHDIMHIANVAKLGWSPVLRSLIGRKRKSDPQVDEVEDGARAKIVEEAVVKAIHSEGERLASLRGQTEGGGPSRLFPSRRDITFRFLKFIHTLVADLEVEKNRYWEWEDAIVDGYDIFDKLRREGQGTVGVDLNSRALTFRPDVYVELAGAVVGVGSHLAELGESELVATQGAILDALDLPIDHEHIRSIVVTELDAKRVSVKAAGAALTRVWDRKVISFRRVLRPTAEGLLCTAFALGDPRSGHS